MTPLVVCADDYALNPGVSKAIIDLAGQGRISATSAMVCSPHWPEHAAWLQAHRSNISVGLHLDWTSPWAVSSGHGMSLGMLMGRSLFGQLDPVRLRAEVERQLDLFESVWQAPPGHVDGHQHIQQFPFLRRAVVEAVQHRYPLHQRPWIRVSQPVRQERGFKPWLIAYMGATPLAQVAARKEVPCSRALVGITDFAGDADHWLQQAEAWLIWALDNPGAVLMCHPGQPDVDARDGIASARVQEWQALSDRRWPLALQRHGLTLSTRPEAEAVPA